MTRFSVGGGDEDDHPSHTKHSSSRRSPLRIGAKRPRTSGPRIFAVQFTPEPASNSSGPTTASDSTAALTQPIPVRRQPPAGEPVTVPEDSEYESGESLDSSTDDTSSSEDESEEEEEEEEEVAHQPIQQSGDQVQPSGPRVNNQRGGTLVQTAGPRVINQRSGAQVQPAEPRVNNQRSGDQVQPAEPPLNSASSGSNSSRELGAPINVTLADPDVLDCPICLEPFSPPVFQCENGHVACASCCTKMRNKCGSCFFPIGYNRCRALEKVLESVKISCCNMQHGCMETMTYCKKLEHEKNCNFAPCSCPHLGCGFVGPSKCLYAHFGAQHSSSSKQFLFNSVFYISLDNNQNNAFLQERSENILFILNRSIEPVGSLINVVCIAPNLSKKGFFYNLTVRAGDSSITLRTFAEHVPKWVAHPPTQKYLVIPSDYVSSSGQLRLEIVILKDNGMVRIVAPRTTSNDKLLISKA